MKKLINVLVLSALTASVSAYADSSKLTKVDLDVKSTHIVKADLDQDDFYYYVDVNACVCWLSRQIGGTPAIATVDCAKLAAHPKLEPYTSKCTAITTEPKQEPVVGERPEDMTKAEEQETGKKDTKKK